MATKQYSCVKRTKKAFETSLAELAKDYPLNKVTVKMLCEKADLSRNAFYFHYKDINNLIEEIENNIIEEAATLIKDYDTLGFPENILATVTALIDLFDESCQSNSIILNGLGHVCDLFLMLFSHLFKLLLILLILPFDKISTTYCSDNGETYCRNNLYYVIHFSLSP